MSAHVLLNLLNELRKRDKMGGLSSNLFFATRKKFFMHLPFKMHKITLFPENLKKNLGFTSKFM